MYARMRFWPLMAIGCLSVAPILVLGAEPQAPVELPMPGTLLWADPQPMPMVAQPAKPAPEVVKTAPEAAKPAVEPVHRPGIFARLFARHTAETESPATPAAKPQTPVTQAAKPPVLAKDEISWKPE